MVKDKYAKEIFKTSGSKFLLKVNGKTVILQLYPLPNQARRMDPEMVMLFKNGDCYPQDVSDLMFKE